MKRILSAFVLAVALVLTLILPVLAYSYAAPYRIVENGGVSYGMLGVYGTCNNTWMAANHFIQPTALDTRVGDLGGTNKPHMVADNATFTAVPVPGNSQTNLYYSANNSLLSSFYIIPGYNGYFTVSDTATLEPSGNFSISFNNTYVDSAAGKIKPLVWKQDALSVYVSPTTTNRVGVAYGDVGVQPIMGTTLDLLNPAATEYNGVMGSTNWNAVEGQVLQVVPANGTFQEFYVRLAAAPGAGTGYTFTLMKNSAPTSLTVTISGAVATTGSDYTHSVSYTASDNISLRSVNIGAPAATYCSWAVGFIPDTANQQIFMAHLIANTAAIRYGQLQGECGTIATETYCNTPIASAGVLSRLYVDLDADPGSPVAPADDYRFVLRVGSANTTLTCVLVADNFTGNDLTHSVAVAAGDRVDWMVTPENVPTVSSNAAVGCVFTPTVPYTYIIIGGTGSNTYGAGVTNYYCLPVSTQVYAATEAFYYSVARSMGTVGNFYVGVDSAAGGNTVFNIRAAAGNTGITVTMTNPNTSANDTAHFYMPAYAAVMDIQVVDATGVARYTNWSFQVVQNGSLNSTEVACSSASHNITASLNVGTMKIQCDAASNTVVLSANITDMPTDWLFMYNKIDYCVPYADNISYSVNGTEKALWKVTTPIIGTTLLDTHGSYNGVFTFGTKPTGVTVTIGGMVSSSVGIGGVSTTVPSDILPTVKSSDWYGDGTVTKASTLANPLRPFITMISDNTMLDEIQVWRFLGVAVLLFATVLSGMALRGHQGITSIIAGAVLGGLVAFDSNIFPMWLLVLSAGCFVGGVVAERSPSV